jgi:hypothetical protein
MTDLFIQPAPAGKNEYEVIAGGGQMRAGRRFPAADHP